jgi:hypothetical protein
LESDVKRHSAIPIESSLILTLISSSEEAGPGCHDKAAARVRKGPNGSAFPPCLAAEPALDCIGFVFPR